MAQVRDLNPEQLEEGLNSVFEAQANPMAVPGLARSTDIFKMEQANKKTETDLKIEGFGRFDAVGETEETPTETRQELGTTNYTADTFRKGFSISLEDLEDELYGKMRDSASDLALAAIDTQEFRRFRVFREAFTTTGFDGKALCANDHPDSLGGTIDNLETGTLSVSTLDTMFNKFVEQKDNKGKQLPGAPDVLLVPPALFKQALEITKSELASGTADNDMNYFSQLFPGLQVKQTPYINADNGGSDTAFFLLSSAQHKVKTFIRTPMQTWMTPWDTTSNTVTTYYTRFREASGFSDFVGVQGSNGTV